MSEHEQPHDPDVIASAFEQTPTITLAMEGPQLLIAAWNTAAKKLLAPVFGDLGTSVWNVDWIEGTGIYESLRHVLDSGEPFSGHGWRLALPDAAGTVQEVYLDFTYTPWRRPDGSIRGIIATATDVSDTRRRQLTAEARAGSWRERFEVSRDAMTALQAALLPATVPVVPGLQVAGRYMLAEADTAAGGDWFSAYPTTADRVALVVGDVVGHGVAASATMGQLRAVIKERLRSGAPLAAALQAMDDFAVTIPGADATTVCAALLDPTTGELEYCTAGHPPPLLAHDGSWRYLAQTGAGPLGSGQPFSTAQVKVPQDALLLFYTDGLVERPGVPRSTSATEIGDVVCNALSGRPIMPNASSYTADRVCELSLELLTRSTGIADDVTVLAVRRTDPVADLVTHLKAGPGTATTAVERVESWLEAIGAGQTDQLHLRHAIVEIVANSVEHGLSEHLDDGVVDVTAHLAANGEAVIDILDNGHWRDPDLTSAADTGDGRVRGLGLPLARQLLDGLTVQHDDTGTQVRVIQRLHRLAPIISTPGVHARDAGMPSLRDDVTFDLDIDNPDTIIVRGPLLSTTAERLRTRLDIDSRGGTQPLTLDLDAVTHLTSAAVRVLQQARRNAGRQGQQLVLTARPGTVAYDVLQLLNVPVDDRSHAG